MEKNSKKFSGSTSTAPKNCSICGSNAIGVNFGVLTCAPCKAFFRRNARRKELLDLPCRHRTMFGSSTDNVYIRQRLDRYSQIRRCSSCRLRRCFQVGMREELVRTEEENQRYRDLIDLNRRRKKIRQINETTEIFSWRHLSELMNFYEINSIDTFLRERSTRMAGRSTIDDNFSLQHISIVRLSTESFLRSLPLFRTISSNLQVHLCRTNVDPLIFLNHYELNTSCYTEIDQLKSLKTSFASLFGQQICDELDQIELDLQRNIVSDPHVLRLWMAVLFFSSSFNSADDLRQQSFSFTEIKTLFQCQNCYADLLWKYLIQRYEQLESVKILSNLTRIFFRIENLRLKISEIVR